MFNSFSQALNIPLVPYAEWLKRLEHSAAVSDNDSPARLQNNPALAILDFYQSSSIDREEGREAMGLPMLSLDLAKKASPVLRSESLSQLGPSDVHSWLGYWRSVGFLS